MNLWCFCESDFWSTLFCLKKLKTSTASANGNHMWLLFTDDHRNQRAFSTEIKINLSIIELTAISELLFSLFLQRFSRNKQRISAIFNPNVLISAFILQFELLMHENLFLVRCFLWILLPNVWFCLFPYAKHLASINIFKMSFQPSTCFESRIWQKLQTFSVAIKNKTSDSQNLFPFSKVTQYSEDKRTWLL